MSQLLNQLFEKHFPPEREHRLLESLNNRERMFDQMQETAEKLAPLIRFLMPKTRAYAMAGGSLGGFTIHLCIEDWREQYDFMCKGFGSRCLGVDITWFRRTQ